MFCLHALELMFCIIPVTQQMQDAVNYIKINFFCFCRAKGLCLANSRINRNYHIPQEVRVYINALSAFQSERQDIRSRVSFLVLPVELFYLLIRHKNQIERLTRLPLKPENFFRRFL